MSRSFQALVALVYRMGSSRMQLEAFQPWVCDNGEAVYKATLGMERLSDVGFRLRRDF